MNANICGTLAVWDGGVDRGKVDSDILASQVKQYSEYKSSKSVPKKIISVHQCSLAVPFFRRLRGYWVDGRIRGHSDFLKHTAVTLARPQGSASLFADTESAEDAVEDVVGVDGADNFAELVQRGANFRRDQLLSPLIDDSLKRMTE